MNEKIKEFIIKATTVEKGLPNYDLTANTVISKVDLEMFSEMIIRDVVKTAKLTQSTNSDFEWNILNNYNLEIE